MKTAYFREGQHYSLDNLCKKFSLDRESTKHHINTLKKYSVLKTMRKEKPEYSELSDQDIIIGEIPDDSSDFTYQFTFVGVILLDGLIFFCYPKYIDITVDNKDEIFERFKIIIKVLEKYNQKEQLVHLYNGEAESKQFNRLAISLHILADYFENGLYTNQQDIIEVNGNGEILWDKTIDETFAIINNNTPYYLDFYTHDNTENDFDYIRRLHMTIISECSRNLNVEKLLDLFDLSEAELSTQTLTDFGDTDYIKYRIEQELKNQFITKKQSLLKTLYTYVSEQSSNESNSSFSLYGTNTFNLVWEKACGELFDNVYDKSWTVKRFAEAGFINSELCTKENKANTISDYIEKPEWKIGGQSVSYEGDLIPDIVALRKEDSGNTAMYILDGKYYLLSVTGDKLSGNPGIQDVVKQYIYNSSLKSFIDSFQIGEIANAFLIPALDSENVENQVFGEVPYWTVQHSGFSELPSVQVIKLNPQKVWNCYLDKDKENDSVFNLIQTSPTANYLYHNENDNSIIQINDNKKHILVGFMRKEYFNHIENRIKKNSKDFIFYFYATGIERDSHKFVRYPVHPYIDSCSEVILYTEDRKRFIRGSLKSTKGGRCKIDEISSDSLMVELLKNEDFSKTISNAKNYYTVTVESSSISKTPYNGISDYTSLEDMIRLNGLNFVLFRTSPKVIDV